MNLPLQFKVVEMHADPYQHTLVIEEVRFAPPTALGATQKATGLPECPPQRLSLPVDASTFGSASIGKHYNIVPLDTVGSEPVSFGQLATSKAHSNLRNA